jgi:hypothetical protein
MLVLVNLGLPALLLLLRVPSFTIGDENIWILRWQNETTGSEIQFNLLSWLVIAVGIGLIGLVIRVSRDRHD